MINKKGFIINGSFHRLTGKLNLNLHDFLKAYLKERFSQRCAISMNKKLIPRNLWKETNIKENDKIEVVYPFRGG